MAKCKGGRPTVMTPEVLSKLDHAFSMGCTDEEACCYAKISIAPFYVYQDKTEGFKERKDQLKQNPVMLARMTVVEGLEEDPDLAMKFLERKCKKEFSTRSENQNLDKDGNPADASLKVEFVGVKK